MDITIFTDGSCNNNAPMEQRCGGYGVYFPHNQKNNISKKLHSKRVSSQVAELTAIIKGIEKCISTTTVKKIIIYSDSMYSIKCVTEWSEKWRQNNWRKSTGEKIENKKLIKTLYFYNKNLNLEFHHVRSHRREPEKGTQEHKLWYGNYMADKLATSGAKQ